IRSGASGFPRSITEEKADCVIRMSRLCPVRRFDGAALQLDLDHPLRVGLVITAILIDLQQFQTFGHRRADHGHIVPGSTGDWLGGLLQPGIVDVAAVVNAGIGPEDDLYAFATIADDVDESRFRNVASLGCQCARGESAAADISVMNRAAPPFFKILPRMLRAP